MTEKYVTVLVVDDDRTVLQGIARTLRGGPFWLRTACSGAEALEILQRDQVDILLTDEMMPGIRGTDLLKQAKALSADTVTILLSGKLCLPLALQAINACGAFRVLSKPCGKETLVLSLREARERWLAQHLVPPETSECEQLEDLFPGITKIERNSQGAICLELGAAGEDRETE